MHLGLLLKHKDFFKKITLVGISFTISSVLLFLFHIYLGRYLGPHGYGKFTYIMTVGNFLSILYALGLQSAIINIISPKSGEDRKECLTTTLILISVFTVIVSILYLALQNLIGTIFELEVSLVKYSILFAFAFSFFNIVQAFVQALQDMKAVSMMRLLSSIFFVLIFFGLQYVLADTIGYKSAITCKIAGLLLALSLIVLVSLRKEISFRLFNIRSTGVLFHYALYGFLLQLSAVFILEFTKVILNKYFDAATIGLFQVYMVSSVSIAQMVITSIVVVYFPSISKSNNKERVIEILSSYEKYLPLLFIPLCISSFVFFKMYGNQYQLNLATLALFNVYVVFLFVSSIYSRTLESFGVYGIRSSFLVSLAGATITVLLSVLSIPVYGINGAIISMATTRIFFYLAFKAFLRRKLTPKLF